MFGAWPAVGDDAVDALVAGDVLAKRRDGLVAHHQGVEGVDAALGHGSRVGGLAAVHDLELRHRDAGHAHQVDARGVHHQRRVDAVEGALARHQLLAAAVLLGGGAEHTDAPRQALAERGEGDARAPTPDVAIRL